MPDHSFAAGTQTARTTRILASWPRPYPTVPGEPGTRTYYNIILTQWRDQTEVPEFVNVVYCTNLSI